MKTQLESINKHIIKPDKIGKYYLIDKGNNNIIIEPFNGLNREDSLLQLNNLGILNIEKIIKSVGPIEASHFFNNVLNGISMLGRFKFYRTSKNTVSLNEQISKY